jgi:hypothetical protein
MNCNHRIAATLYILILYTSRVHNVRVIKQILVITEAYHVCQLLTNILLSKLTLYADEILGIITVAFDETGQLLITYFAFVKYLRKNGNTTGQCISYL